MSSRTAFPRDDAESLDRSRKIARLGVALVRLENLSYQPPEGRPRISLQPRKTEYWLREFRLRGCFPNVCGNRIRAEISQQVLAPVLDRSGLRISDLQDAGHIKRIHLPKGTLLTHYHGQHRIEAAKQHIYPHNEWWAVELYDKETWDNKCRAQEQARNIESFPHDDGTVFRFLDTEPDWRTAWRSKDAENDLKAIEKRPALYKGFTSLRPFVGLWASFQNGTLHRYKSLRCDEELIRYFDRIKRVWTFILDGDEELIYDLDPETVKLFEGRAPKASSADRDFITRAIESRSAFPLLYDDVKRLRLLQNVVAVDGMIPSIKTLAKDSLHLEDCAKAMRILIDPTKCHMRQAMQHMWHGYGGDFIVLESADGLTEYGDTRTGDEGRFEIAYVQLWMFAMRNFHRLTNLVPKSDNKQKVPRIGPEPRCLLEFARLANALGFRSNTITSALNADADREHARNMLTIARPPGRYDYDLESEITSHYQLLTRIRARQQELLRPPVWTTTLLDVKLKQRYGRPHNQALKDCAPYFFLHNICEMPKSGKYVTDLFVKRGIACSFFRIPLLLPEAARHGNRMEVVVVDGRGTSQQPNQASQAQTSTLVRDVAQDARLKSRLKDCQRQVAKQQEEISHYKVKLSEVQAQTSTLVRDAAQDAGLKSRLEDCQRQVAKQQEEISHYKVKLSEVQAQASTLVRQDAGLKSRLEDCQRQVAKQQEEISHYKVKLSEIQAQTSTLVRDAAQDAGLKSRLENCQRQVAEQQEEISHYNLRLPEAQANSELLLAEVQLGRDRIKELEAINLDQSRKHLQAHLEFAETLGQRQQKIETLERTIADQESAREMQVVQARQHQDQREMEIFSQQATTELNALHFAQLEMDNLRRIEDINTKAISQGFQERVIELELFSQSQAEDLRNSKEVATIKGRTLDMILAKIKETREGVEKMSTAFTGLQLEQNYEDGDCKTIHSDELQFEDLPIAGAHFDEIEDLKKSIAKFIALYSQNNLALDEIARVKILEWQKLVPGERLTIADGTGIGVETENPDLKQMLAVVSRRAGFLKQEGQAVHDLQAELYVARATAESQRQKAELVEGLEEKLAEVGKQLQQERVATRDLIGTLKGELDTTKAKNEALLQQGKVAIAELTAKLKTVKADADTLQKEERERELGSLKLEIDNEDERISLLKAQLSETNRLIQLEKEKEKLEAEQKEIQATLSGAIALDSQDLGKFLQREALVNASLSQTEEKMVETVLDAMRYAKYKVRFENSNTGRQIGVDYVLIEDLEKKFEELRDQVVYCFVNDIMTVVELEKYKDFLANQKHRADHGEFFYCSDNTPRKRHRGLDDVGEDLKKTSRTQSSGTV